jgi:hypothetical protein
MRGFGSTRWACPSTRDTIEGNRSLDINRLSYWAHRHHGAEQHPIGKILPPMSAQERSSLHNDLAVNGLQLLITGYEGMVLDGWNRYQPCIEENITPRFVDYGGEDPFGYVRSLNLSRRHLTLAQKKEIAKHIFEREPLRIQSPMNSDLATSEALRVRGVSRCRAFSQPSRSPACAAGDNARASG